MKRFDAIVIGAGAAGMMCAARAGQAGKRVALIDHSERLAEKIRISGGGRCNFTNLHVSEGNFLGENPAFAAKALRAFPSSAFVGMVKQYGIAFHEKHKGQLFCDGKSESIIGMLAAECDAGGVAWFRPCSVSEVSHDGSWFSVTTNKGLLTAKALVVATGGLPIPKIGATDFGLRLAKQFGHRLVETRPALVPLTFDLSTWKPWAELAGISLPVLSRGSEVGAPWFEEDLLFTHRGLSGPAVLQASSYWQPNEVINLNLLANPNIDDWVAKTLKAGLGVRGQLNNWLPSQLPHWPKRLLEHWLKLDTLASIADRKVAELGKKQLKPLAAALGNWQLLPNGSEGYRKAEVMRGGVATDQLSSESMESKRQPGLYFVGEVVDVTGWLGGYNFQWAWASGVAAAKSIAKINT